MKTVNSLIEKLYKDAKDLITHKQKNDQAEYKVFLKNLIVQVSRKFKQSHFLGSHQAHGGWGARPLQKEWLWIDPERGRCRSWRV